MSEFIAQTIARIERSAQDKSALRPRGAGSKDFHACALNGDIVDMRPYSGIVNYDPTELVITARAGTPLAQIEETLAERGQMLGFEPPRFSSEATLGGCIATGWSGPRRAYAGSVRDFVLGMRVLNGRGQDLHFGGEVMKNVAGFDVSRLLTGAFGTLGLILEVSLKVLPRPQREVTLSFDMEQATAITTMNQWAGQPLPLSATAWFDNRLYVRLSGPSPAIDAALSKLGGTPLEDTPWKALRDQTLPSLQGDLWRLSIKSSSAPLSLPGTRVLEWNGALRWLATEAPADTVHAAARAAGGHALRYRGTNMQAGVFALDAATLKLHQRLKQALDPDHVFSPGRLHPAL
ncbi:MAG: glycolate oxidase subunit GlcE [Betaproteobacteria bacterium]|nr:glycolate oxidase subunit GlcE [Betaproteobacteria bacterium]